MSSAEIEGSKENRHDDPKPNKGTEDAKMQGVPGVTAAEGEGLSLADGNGQELQMSNTRGAFTLFGKLPLELRLTIWKMALPGPTCIQSSTSNDKYGEVQFGLRYDKPPTILFVSRESRAVALPYHQAPLSKDDIRYHEVRYFNTSSDCLYHRDSCRYTPVDVVAIISERFPHLSKLACHINHVRPDVGSFLRSLTKFNCLKELVITAKYKNFGPKRGRLIKEFNKEVYRLRVSATWVFWPKIEAIQNALTEMEKRSTVGWKAPKLRVGRSHGKRE